LAFGDAICSFNPIYGQGMTVAAIEATMLQQCLREGKRDLPRRFFDAAAKQIRVAWQTAVGSDLTLPEVVGPRPMSMRVTNAYLGWVLQADGADPVVAGQFLRVTGMMDSPASLVKPSFMLRVAKARLRGPAVQLRAQVAGGAGDGRRLMTVTVVRRFGSPRVQPQSERSAP
jgi:2-polyprenyl-6-methoxyphenol hydroxylase-like FAD-dependent oxidoreductase